MDILNKLKSLKPFEFVLITLFIIYIIFPIHTPDMLKPYVDSPLAIVLFFVMIVSFFLYTTPILGVLSILVVYELLRRSTLSNHVSSTRMDGDSSWYTDPVAYVNNVKPSAIAMAEEKNKDEQLKAMNPQKQTTLEEDIVRMRAPIGISEPTKYIDSDYKPVADKIYSGGSII